MKIMRKFGCHCRICKNPACGKVKFEKNRTVQPRTASFERASVPRELRCAPSSTYRFNQDYTCLHSASHDVDVIPFIIERSSLPGDYLQIIIDATFVTGL